MVDDIDDETLRDWLRIDRKAHRVFCDACCDRAMNVFQKPSDIANKNKGIPLNVDAKQAIARHLQLPSHLDNLLVYYDTRLSIPPRE